MTTPEPQPATAPPAPADLAERVESALRTTPVTGQTYQPGHERFDHHPRLGEPGHRYVHNCALCRGDTVALTAAVLAVIAPELAELTEAKRQLATLRDALGAVTGQCVAAEGRQALVEAELAENTGVLQALRRQRDTAETLLHAVRGACDQLHAAAVLADGQPHTDRERGIVDAVARIRQALDANPTSPKEPTR